MMKKKSRYIIYLKDRFLTKCIENIMPKLRESNYVFMPQVVNAARSKYTLWV